MHSSLSVIGGVVFAALASTGATAPTSVPPAEPESLLSLDSRSLGSAFDQASLADIPEIVSTAITTITSLITALKSGQTTQNGLTDALAMNQTSAVSSINSTDSSACPDIAVLFARGTGEPGNMGFVTGPPLVSALQAYSNGSRVLMQGIDYEATIPGFLAGGDAAGSRLMAQLTNTTMAMCPDSKVVLAGYSQGAQVVRNACVDLGNPAAAKLSSVVMFGDPKNGTAVAGVDASRTVTFCHDGDNICEGGTSIKTAHLDYSRDAPAGAMFIMQKSGLGVASPDAVMEGMGGIPMLMQTDEQGAGTTQNSLGKRWWQRWLRLGSS